VDVEKTSTPPCFEHLTIQLIESSYTDYVAQLHTQIYALEFNLSELEAQITRTFLVIMCVVSKRLHTYFCQSLRSHSIAAQDFVLFQCDTVVAPEWIGKC
jgi:hypothetical protein